MIRKYRNKLLLLGFLIIAGVVLQAFGFLEPQLWIGFARQYGEQWWMIPLLILAQVVLFTFALAGALFLWVAATLYDPITATFILAMGTVLGGISAYYFSSKLTDEWIHKVENSQVYRLLHKNDNFFTQFALRVMPAFPHSLINYSSGILKVRMIHFISAALLGNVIKSYIFSSAISQAVSSASVMDLMDLKILAPMIILSVSALGAVVIKARIDRAGSKPAEE